MNFNKNNKNFILHNKMKRNNSIECPPNEVLYEENNGNIYYLTSMGEKILCKPSLKKRIQLIKVDSSKNQFENSNDQSEISDYYLSRGEKYTLPGYQLYYDLDTPDNSDENLSEEDADENEDDGDNILDRIKIVVWDFDHTLTKVSICKNLTLQTAKTEPLDKIFSDIELIKSTFEYLREVDIHIAIASYANKDMITTLIGRLFVDEYEYFPIITPRDVSSKLKVNWPDCTQPNSKYGFNKNTMIEMIRDYYENSLGFVYPFEILLIDDDERNVQNAIDYGYQGLRIPATGYQRNLDPEALNPIASRSLSSEDFKTYWNDFYLEYI
jgi:hypothetical protein